jgi:hypothetical protein
MRLQATLIHRKSFPFVSLKKIQGMTTVSKVSLVTVYHQILAQTNWHQQSAITIPFDLLDFPFTSFSLLNATKTFQNFITGSWKSWTSVSSIWKHHCLQLFSPGAQPTPPYPLYPTPILQYHFEPIQVCFPCPRSILPCKYDVCAIVPSLSQKCCRSQKYKSSYWDILSIHPRSLNSVTRLGLAACFTCVSWIGMDKIHTIFCNKHGGIADI